MSRYRTTPERAGGALALGGGAVGCGVALTAWAGGASGPSLVGLGLLGALLGALGIAGVAGPIWYLLGRRRRGPVAAGLTGAGVTSAATLLILTQGTGLGLPLADAATLAAIWTSAIASAAVAAFLGGLIALAMWLVSYRPR